MKRSAILQEQQESQIDQPKQQEQELGWVSFSKSKSEIDTLMRQLLPKFRQYRKLLIQTGKQICQQTFSNFSFKNYEKEEEVHQDTIHQPPMHVMEKKSLVQKIIKERQIKRFYKNKHQVNFEDELDPEDDQAQIYKFYQQTFKEKKQTRTPAGTARTSVKGEDYNQHYMLNKKNNKDRGNDDFDSIFNRNQIQISDMYNMNAEADILMDKFPSSYTPYSPQLLSFANVENRKVGFQIEPSIDNHFLNPTTPIQNLAKDRSIAMDPSKKQLLNKDRQSKQIIKSQSDNIYKEFLAKQNEELTKQRKRVQELTEKAYKVLNNEIQEQEEHGVSQLEEKLNQFRFLLGEIVEVQSVAECMRYLIKFRAYQLLNKLYQHASNYYQEDITFQQPLEVKHFAQIVQACLPQEKQDGIRVIINQIFDKADKLSYDQFIQRMSPHINEKEFESILNNDFNHQPSKTFDLTVRLFNTWIQLDYFQVQIKTLLQQNQECVDKFIDQVTQNAILMPGAVADFITKHKKSSIKKVKVDILLRKILGKEFHVTNFYTWIQTKKQKEKVNEKFQEMQESAKMEYYYNYY